MEENTGLLIEKPIRGILIISQLTTNTSTNYEVCVSLKDGEEWLLTISQLTNTNYEVRVSLKDGGGGWLLIDKPKREWHLTISQLTNTNYEGWRRRMASN
jgi:hypothetical protein